MNPRPDALMKEQLVEMTGLSPRVIRVWFQNKRCKHNKKANALKLQMEREKVSFVLISIPIRNIVVKVIKCILNLEIKSFYPQIGDETNILWTDEWRENGCIESSPKWE